MKRNSHSVVENKPSNISTLVQDEAVGDPASAWFCSGCRSGN